MYSTSQVIASFGKYKQISIVQGESSFYRMLGLARAGSSVAPVDQYY